jgi:CheY-like chemotaxis protein
VEDEPPPGLPVRVLLVEDDPVVARGLRRTLERAGLDVLVVTDGDEALAVLGATRFNVVVSDVAMRRVGGVALTHEARRRWPDLPLLLISGTPPDEGALPPGVRCLEKPFEAAELLTTIRRLVAEGAVEDAPRSA